MAEFSAFTASVTAPMRRALLELERLIYSPKRMVRFTGTDVTAADGTGFAQFGEDGSFNIGIDNNEIQARNNDAASGLAVQSEGGDFAVGVVASPKRFYYEAATGEVRDGIGRQFVRTDTSRSDVEMIQRGTHGGTTDANGLMTVTFPEAFTGTPEIVIVPASNAANIVAVTARSTTGFTVKYWAPGGAILASTARTFMWVAIGPKAL